MGGGGSSLKSAHFIVFYSEGRQYYNTFKPLLDSLDSIKHLYTFYTSDEDDPALKRDTSVGEYSYIGKGNKAYARLNMLKADICVLTTPGLDVLHIKRSRGVKHYCHIVHSISPMTYRVFGIDYFDSVLVANEVQEDFVREVEKAHNVKRKYIAITGSTYLDELSCNLQSSTNLESSSTSVNPITLKDKSKKTILISPSWGKETLLSKYGLKLLEPLARTGYNIIVRPHPQSFITESEAQNIASLKETLAKYDNLIWDQDTPNIYAFSLCDMMISDFSSVIFDFVCLQGKPVLTIKNDMDLSGYDMADVSRDSIWTFKALERIGGRCVESEFANIGQKCDEVMQNTKDLDSVRKLLWRYPHSAGDQSVLELLKIERELIESSLKPQSLLISRLRELDSMISLNRFTHSQSTLH